MFLVVGPGPKFKVFLEEDSKAVGMVLAGSTAKYYAITLDKDGNPSLSAAAAVKAGPREEVTVAERVELVADGVVVAIGLVNKTVEDLANG